MGSEGAGMNYGSSNLSAVKLGTLPFERYSYKSDTLLEKYD